jgi:hypothetical protein
VLAAGLGGTIHFTGARWFPHWLINWRLSSPTNLRHPRPTVSTTSTPSRGIGGAGGVGAALPWVLAAVVAVVVAGLAWRWWSRRRARPTPSSVPAVRAGVPSRVPEREVELDRPAMRTALEQALQALDEERDPTDAIVRAWLGLQGMAETSGLSRQPAETPTEFTTRIMRRASADDEAVRTLLRLYLRTRFGDYHATPVDVAVARAALQQLALTWPAPRSQLRASAR